MLKKPTIGTEYKFTFYLAFLWDLKAISELTNRLENLQNEYANQEKQTSELKRKFEQTRQQLEHMRNESSELDNSQKQTLRSMYIILGIFPAISNCFATKILFW